MKNLFLIPKKELFFLIVPISVIIAIIAVMVIPPLLNPLRRSNEHIRESLLKLTPLGSTMEDVIEVVKLKKNGSSIVYGAIQ